MNETNYTDQSLLGATEFFLELAEVHFDQGWAAMRAGVGHGTMTQIFDQIFQLGSAQGVIGFDGMATNSFRDGMLAEAQRIDLLPRGFQFIDQAQNKEPGIGHFHKGRQRIDQKGSLAKFAQADAEARERWQMIAQEGGVASRQLDRFGQEEFLRIGLSIFLFETIEHLFEENALVGGMLIQQDQAAIGFE